MKISEALQRIDALYPNSFSEEDKLRWLSNLDWTIKVEIIDIRSTHSVYSGYNADTDMETELLAPAPYDDMYIYWMQAMIDWNNQELASYNNSISRFNEVYAKYRNWYNRDNMVQETKLRFW